MTALSGPEAEEEGGHKEDREALSRVLVAMVWMPIQVTASLIFATGGMFLLLVLGIIFSPFIGLYFLIRRANGEETSDSITDPGSGQAG